MGQDDMLAALAEILADVARIDPADVTPRPGSTTSGSTR